MMFNRIFEAFPTPKILDIPFAGLSISDSAIRCIQFGKKGKKLYIEKYTEKSLAPGVITHGQVNNKEELIEILRTLKKDLNLDYVKVSLPEEKAYLFTAKIPIVKSNEVKSAVESKIEENVPVNPNELVYDYKLTNHREKGHLDVVVSSLPMSVVDMYADIVVSAELSLLSLEIESQAIARALIKKDNIGTVLLVHFEQEKVGLYVVTNRVVRFTSTIPTKGDFSKNPEFLLHEIKKLYTYWHTLKENIDRPEKKINQIIISGENIMDNIVQYLSTKNSTSVTSGNVWINIFDIEDVVPDIGFSDSLSYVVAIGLALSEDVLM